MDNILHIVANSLHLMVNRETVVSLLNAVDVFMGHLYVLFSVLFSLPLVSMVLTGSHRPLSHQQSHV